MGQQVIVKPSAMSKRMREIVEKTNKFEIKTGAGVGCDWPSWESGKGVMLKDVDGNEYLDLIGGLGGCLILGHCHPRIVQVIKNQAEKLLFARHYMPDGLRADVAEKLVDVSPKGLDKVMYALGGSDVIEKSIPFAKCYTKKMEIMTYQGAFHGRGELAKALSASIHIPPNPFLIPQIPGIVRVPYPNCYRCPFGKEYPDCDIQCARFIEDLFENPSSGITQVAAILGEIIQGDPGVIIPPKEYWPLVKRICEKNNALLITDECQTSFGHTGKMFACEHYGIVPDLMCVSKGLANGMPISAIIGKAEILEQQDPMRLSGCTYIGNTLSYAVALETIKIVQEDRLVENAARVGKYLQQRLMEIKDKHKLIGDVRAKGLYIGIEFVKERKMPAIEETKTVAAKLLQRRVIVDLQGPWRSVIQLRTPLILTEELAEVFCGRLEETLMEVH